VTRIASAVAQEPISKINGEPVLFDTILNNMSHGVLMFDQAARLIFATGATARCTACRTT
jgi:hypothetical protein